MPTKKYLTDCCATSRRKRQWRVTSDEYQAAKLVGGLRPAVSLVYQLPFRDVGLDSLDEIWKHCGKAGARLDFLLVCKELAFVERSSNE